jgi:hypothetical protein
MRRLILVFAGAYGVMGCSSCCNSHVASIECTDNDPNGNPYKGECTTNSDCPDHYLCRTQALSPTKSEQCCQLEPRICKVDSDCCPGETCPPTVGECYDVCVQCTKDSDCGGQGELFCLPFSDGQCGPTRCMYKQCSAYPNSACPAGQACFNGLCILNQLTEPCGRTCPSGQACVTQIDKCQVYGSECQLTCKPGYLAVYTDPTNIWDSCNKPALACQCEELPPLTSDDLGRHSSITTLGNNSYVSMYDGQYKNLVIATINANGSVGQMQWVDGVPATGTIVAAPDGPRGGIADLGTDVGKYTSIGVGAGNTLRVSYYDETDSALKYIEKNSAGTWTNAHIVDTVSGGDVGVYTSIAFDPSGNPAIAYFQRAGGTGTTCASAPANTPSQYLTALKLATATKPHPAAATDWTVETVDCAARPIPPCASCTASQVCVTQGGTISCATSASGCAPACGSGQVCIMSGATPTCVSQENPSNLLSVPQGVGVFASLAFNGTTPAIAYYDSINGYLKTAVKSGTWKIVTVDGRSSSGASTANVGLFPSLVVSNSQYLLAYHDFTHRYLRWLTAPTSTGFTPVPDADQLNPTPAEIIDTGITPPTGNGPTWVGASTHLVMVGTNVFVVYQNATAVSMKLAGQNSTTGTWSVINEYTQVGDGGVGGLGFWSDATNLNGLIVMSHAQIHTYLVMGQAALNNSLIINTYHP